MSNSLFDGSLDTHADLINKRTSGNGIAGEPHTIPSASPYTVIMAEVPDEDEDVTVTGASTTWTEVSSVPAASGEYQVDYTRGIITFHADDKSKSVYFAYTGLGNCVLADHINDRTYSCIQIQRVIGTDARGPHQRYVSISNRLSQTVGRLEAYADSSVATKIQISAGRFALNPSAIYEMAGYSMDFGAAGTHQLVAIPANQYKRIVVVADQGARYKVYVGNPTVSSNPPLPIIAAYADEIPICGIKVQDNGSGTAGSIKRINESDITDYRPLVAAPPKGGYRIEAGRAYITAAATPKTVTFCSGFTRIVSVTVTPDAADTVKINSKSGSNFVAESASGACHIDWIAAGYDY